MTSSNAPSIDELEISLFGPGFGEGIVIHYGLNNWIIIDSCVDPIYKESVPLKYLKRLNVDVSKDVKYIVATHWHDDHIRGISDALEKCSSAEFICSAALLRKEFVTFVKSYDDYIQNEDTGVNEINKVYGILKKNNSTVIRAIVDRIIFSNEFTIHKKKYQISLTSLSPSDEELNNSFIELGRLISEIDSPKRRAVSINPNNTSVVLNLKIDKLNTVLGADLEDNGDIKRGWKAIVNKSNQLNKNVNYFKVAHHGSINGFNEIFWKDYLGNDCICTLTPFQLGKHNLPTIDMKRKICSTTLASFITVADSSRIKRDNRTEKIIKETVGDTLKIKSFSSGHIRWRQKINNPMGKSIVELFNKAQKLC